MDFGDTATLRTLSSELAGQGSQADALHRRISSGVSGLTGSVSKYERGAAAAFLNRWDVVGGVIRSLASDSDAISRALATLADALDDARREWSNAEDAAWSAGFSVWPTDWSVTITVPSDATDDDRQHAATLEQRMRGAVEAAESARERCRRVAEDASDKGLSELRADGSGSAYVSTGDGGLDREIERVVAPMLAAHATISGGV